MLAFKYHMKKHIHFTFRMDCRNLADFRFEVLKTVISIYSTKNKMNEKQLAMGLFALGASALPLTDKMIKESGNPESATISSKAYENGGMQVDDCRLQTMGKLISVGADVKARLGLLCGIQAALGLITGS